MTRGTAEWIIGKSGIIAAIDEVIMQNDNEVHSLGDHEFVEGPIRLAHSASDNLTVIWNIDYLSGTGEETWGFIKISGESSLRESPSIRQETLERCMYVINQRMQGLLIDGAFIHRAYDNGAHTCLAGKGALGRQSSIGYFERTIDGDQSPMHSVMCVGPGLNFDLLASIAEREGKKLATLSQVANSMIDAARKRSIAETRIMGPLRRALAAFSTLGSDSESAYRNIQVATGKGVSSQDVYKTLGLTYDDWISSNSPLSDVQRRILFSDVLLKHPLRIIGPGGSGKTLLMQLLALRALKTATDDKRALRILYIAHNSAMAEKVQRRFLALTGGNLNLGSNQRLDVNTLAEYGRATLNLEATAVINPDAEEAKQFQLEQVTSALDAVLSANSRSVVGSRLFAAASTHPEIRAILSRLLMTEISTAIKGHGLENDKKRYVQSERRLSRFHGILTQEERSLVFQIFQEYHKLVFESYEVLDTDDLALSLLGRLRTPIWELKRKKLGYDFVFVDETQLFNENERRVFSLLTNGNVAHMPIALALDEAQDIYAQSSAGLSTLGIPNIENENLGLIQRSTKAIVDLAFFVIQRSTDLFGPDFPDFTGSISYIDSKENPLAEPPRIDTLSEDSRSLGRYATKRIREFRKSNLRQIAIICHSDAYWDGLHSELKTTDLPFQVLLQRGVKLPLDEPLVVLTKPAYVGGQEFDAVILVGLEQGVSPPRIPDNEALSSAIEQQTMREMYLSITRARYRVLVLLSHGATPTALLQDAMKAGLIVKRN